MEMATFTITFILFTLYLIPFGNCVYLPNGQNFVPNGGNQLIGSAGGGGFPSATSTIQNGPRDRPNGQYFVPNGGNQLIGAAGGGDFPSASSTTQNSPRGIDIPYYVPGNQNPNYRRGTLGSGAGSLPFPNKYPAYPTESGLTITVNSVNTAVSTSSSEPSSNQLAEQGSALEDF